MLIDIGLNLTSSQFDRDRNEVIERAVSAGVERMILTGTSVGDSRDALHCAQEYPHILSSTVGIHPHDARHFNENSISELRSLAEHKEVVAIGECGLDHNRNFSSPEDQARCFEAQIRLAKALNFPLFMHERDAHEAFVEILEPHLGGHLKGIVHCFTGNKEVLRRYLDLGLYIGITGWLCDERRGQDLIDALKWLPLDRMMLETDAPYLIPRSLRPRPKSRRNEPMYLPHIAQAVADVHKCELEVVIEETGRNAMNFFGLVET